VRQRTQLINALRGHLAEFGQLAPKGALHLKLLQTALKGSDVDLPAPVREMRQIHLQQIN
jgi:transposase